MKTFQINEQPFVAPIDLQTLNTTYSNLQTRHNEAIKATSELKTAIANLNLNESEENFRQQLVFDIENTIDNNTRFGNSAGAYNDIVKLSGDIASNPQLISKLKAQQDYQIFIKELEARTDLPEHYKEYYKRINPYKEGIYDDKGNWVKGTKWEPIKKAALNIDKNEIMRAALQYVSPNKGSYSVTTWMDSNGNLTKEYTEGAKLVRYNTQTYQYENVTEKEIKDAITSAIRANPQYMNSLKQDYDIAVDDFEDKRQGMFNVNNGTGKPISFETFVDNIFSPMVKSKAYSYTTLSKEDFNKNVFKELKAMGLSQIGTPNKEGKGYSMPGENTTYVDNSYVVSSINVNRGNTSFKESIKNIEGVTDEFVTNTNLSNPEAFKQALDSLNLSEESYNLITENYNLNRARYAEDLHNKAKFDELYGDSKGGAAKKTISYIASGEFPEDMNVHEERFYNTWQRINDFYFPKGMQSIRIATPNKKTYETFQKLAKEANLTDYFKLGTDSKGRYTIELNRSNNSKLFELSNLYQQARKEGKKGQPIRHLWHELGSAVSVGGDRGGIVWGEALYAVSDSGSTYNLLNRLDQALVQRYTDESNVGTTINMVIDAATSSPYTEIFHKSHNTAGRVADFIPPVRGIRKLFNKGLILDVGNMLQPITDYKDRLNRISARNDFGEEKLVSNLTFKGATPEAIKAQSRLDNGDYEDSTERTMLQNVVREANESTFFYAQQQGLRNTNVKVLNKNGIFEKVLDSSDIEKLQNQFRFAKSNAPTSLSTIELDNSTGRYVRRIQFVNNDKKPVTMLLDYDNVSDLTDLNNNPSLKSYRKFYESEITGNDIRLGSYAHTDIYATPLGDGNYAIIAGDASNPFNIINSSSKDFDLLQNTKEAEENLLMLAELLQMGQGLDDNTLNQMSDYIGNYVTNLLTLLGINPKDEGARNWMYEDIAKDTGFNFN